MLVFCLLPPLFLTGDKNVYLRKCWQCFYWKGIQRVQNVRISMVIILHSDFNSCGISMMVLEMDGIMFL